jgi:hypothetical protein
MEKFVEQISNSNGDQIWLDLKGKYLLLKPEK